MNTPTEIQVETGGARLDRYVAEHLPELSRAAVQRLIDDGFIRVNAIARKASYRVSAGETITVRVPPPESATPRAEKIPLDILYEDDDLIVINKPAGMVVHPAAGHSEGTLVNAMLAHCPNLNVGGVERPGIVHRLDSETSGVIVVAKNDAAMRDLQAQFKARRVKKTYLALVHGTVNPPRGKIDAPIGRDLKHRQKMAVMTSGKTRASVTIYRTLANLGQPHAERSTSLRSAQDAGRYTLIEAQPQTGRTHQIRVHLTFLGFPVVADAIYGKKKNMLGLARQFLHAWKLEFALPRDGRAMQFIAPVPEDLRAVLRDLGFAIADL
ncbi:MAG: RluA family pseudouridine synthase [Chloroflexi bacterium]|nr:RluA family pseudouridine synthase [Chloroflexota bacterium]